MKITFSISGIITVISFILPDIPIYIKIIVLLLSVIISLFSYIHELKITYKNDIDKLNNQFNELSAKFEEVENNRNSLLTRFKSNSISLERYRAGFYSIEALILSTVQSDSNERLKNLYDFFLHIKLNMKGLDKND